MKLLKVMTLIAAALAVIYFAHWNTAVSAQTTRIGERPALEEHVNESDIESGSIRFKKLLELGEEIFAARWTRLDGQGRPAGPPRCHRCRHSN